MFGNPPIKRYDRYYQMQILFFQRYRNLRAKFRQITRREKSRMPIGVAIIRTIRKIVNKYCLFREWKSTNNIFDSFDTFVVKFVTKFSPNLNRLFRSGSCRRGNSIKTTPPLPKTPFVNSTYAVQPPQFGLALRYFPGENRLENIQYRIVVLEIRLQKRVSFE